MPDVRPFAAVTAEDAPLVGGKGLSLGRLLAAGLPVPDGFCVTTDAFRRCGGRAPDDALRAAVAEAYRALGGAVAVRSSATGEDGAVTSFAGQQETVLGVEGEAAVCAAVARCWASLDTERARAYRHRQGVDESHLAMAVVVQRMVPAEVAGVLFTRDPLDPAARRMLVEASWGLGEAVVSGMVQPDRFALDHDSGAVVERTPGRKHSEWTPAGPVPLPAEKADALCLTDEQLRQIAELAKRAEAFYGEPRDVEWAWAAGVPWLLQARPITAGGAAEREEVRRSEVGRLRAVAGKGGTVWSRYDPAELNLPEPTPMTWAVARRLLGAGGGLGRMYRDLGFAPHPSLGDDCVYDLVCGRPYCNLDREPLMQYAGVPFAHPFADLKADPAKALAPKAAPAPARFGLGGLLKFPLGLLSMGKAVTRTRQLSESFAAHFRDNVLPEYDHEVRRAGEQDWSRADTAELAAAFRTWLWRVAEDFASESLKPGVFAALAMQTIEQALAQPLGPERLAAAMAELRAGSVLEPDADLAGGVRELAAGRLERAEFLRRYGHRGRREMELAAPRWAEAPDELDALVAGGGRQPAASLETRGADAPRPPEERFAAVADEAKLPGPVRSLLAGEHRRMLDYLALRESCKHHLMRGYAVLRRILLELDRRYELDGGVFFLTPDELDSLHKRAESREAIRHRREYRRLALSLEVPAVLFSDDLDAIGRPEPPPAGADELRGVPLSAGVGEGPALVLTEPRPAAAGERYVLVCPSTDPAWVPLFVHAAALVMETGGVLSHGAIVAREFGLPAVAGLPGVVRRLRDGQRVRVDGGRGVVTVLPS